MNQNKKRYELLDEMFATANINLPETFLEKFSEEIESDKNWELLNDAIAKLQERRDSKKMVRYPDLDRTSGEVKRYFDKSKYEKVVSGMKKDFRFPEIITKRKLNRFQYLKYPIFISKNEYRKLEKQAMEQGKEFNILDHYLENPVSEIKI